MGGSGGGQAFPVGPTDVDRLRERARQIADQAGIDAEVNGHLAERLVSINDRDVAQVSQHLDAILEDLKDHVGGVERTLFGGSVAKHTYVDGLSDVDALVVLDDADLAGATPEEVREHFAETLRAQPSPDIDSVTSGDLAVTVRYHDGTEIQLLPAVQRGERLAISSQDGTTWNAIHPRSFARDLTEVNKRQGGAAVPAIKLAKAIIAERFPETQRPASYHIEALAVAAFRDYTGSRNPKAMLTHFFAEAARGVLRPIKDVSGQSHHVDESLGEPQSSARRMISGELQRIADTMQNSRQLSDWRALLGDG